MDSTVSVSKGCFVFKNGFKKKSSKHGTPVSLFNQQFNTEIWYDGYKSMWANIEAKIEDLNSITYNRLLKDLVNYVKGCYNDENSFFHNEIIPCATLLTGVNQPDHTTQFEALKQQLLDQVTSHVAILYSQDSSTVKNTIENMISQFINNDDNESQTHSDSEDDKKIIIKKTQCNMNILKAWYQEKYIKNQICTPSKRIKSKNSINQLVVIIPEFENFNSETLQDLVLILSGYTPSMPFVIIFGVATSVSTLHKSFPYNVSSKLFIQVFQSHSSTDFLNKILETIFLSGDCPFHLGHKSFKFLMDIFLFYDFSITGFIQGIKFSMMEHFYASKIMALCCPKNKIEHVLSQFDDKDLESIRHLPSFRPYVESQPAAVRISLLLNNEYFRTELPTILKRFHIYLNNFHLMLKILHVFICDLPNSPLGKQLRELYVYCISSSVIDSPEFKQSLKLLEFQSKDDIIEMLKKCLDILDNFIPNKFGTPKKTKTLNKDMLAIRDKLAEHLETIQSSGWNYVIENQEDTLENIDNLDRKQLKERMLKASQAVKPLTEFEVARKNFLEYLTTGVFSKFLLPANTQTFYEIFIFHDAYKVKKNIVGTPRAAIHTALTNPVSYLQCKCCTLAREEMISPTLPDLSIVYKLYLECGKLINLYDWLQAFVTIVEPEITEEEDERRDIKPEIQARFTQAISELQFLGFIKTSKRKTDHVTRLTW